MARMSIRGLDANVLARLKRRAEREGSSLNKLVVRLLHAQARRGRGARPDKTFDDLDALAGTWSAADARAFERATAPFREVDRVHWR